MLHQRISTTLFTLFFSLLAADVYANTAPVANPDAKTIDEDNTTTIQVKDDNGSGADFDVDIDNGGTQTLSVSAIDRVSSVDDGSVTESATDGLVTYSPIGRFNYLAVGESTTDVFTYTLSDGLDTDTGTVTMTVTGLNDTPSIAVDGNLVFQEGDSPVTLDSSITVSDVDTSDLIGRSKVAITNYEPGEDVLACTGTLPAGILLCAFDTNQGWLILVGNASRENYAAALQTVTYENTSLNPTVGDRTITFDVRDDNITTSATDSVIVTVSANTPPTITAPADVTVDAAGLLTIVDLGEATGNDDRDGVVTNIKALVNSTVAEADAKILDLVSDCQNTVAEFDTAIDPLRPGSYTVIWASCDSQGDAGHAEQTVNVQPQASVSLGQSVGENQPVVIQVTLNGAVTAPSAAVDYSLAGTASAGDDHDGVNGTVTLGAPDFGLISFNTLTDVLVEGDETVVVTLHTPSNIALSTAKTHTVTITEANLAPQAVIVVTQPSAAAGSDVNKGNTVYTADGVVEVIADARDGNGDPLSFDWSATDASLLAAAGTTITLGQLDFDPSVLVADNFYNVVATISDGAASITIQHLLQVKTATTVTLTSGEDRDGDGINDDIEGFGDDDFDGIPNYADDASIPANAIENNTVNFETNFLIETDPGLHIALGDIAVAAQASGLQVSLQDIADHGGSGGSSVTNAATDYTFLSSLLNFEITGLSDATESVNVVIPLQSSIQADSVHRKYSSSGWFDFVVDDKNIIRSAAGEQGTCPQPGSDLYVTGLNVGDFCLQLTIQDGGANDTDGVRNFIVRDPGALALAPKVGSEPAPAPAPASDSGGSGSINLWFMLLLSLASMLTWRIRGQKV